MTRRFLAALSLTAAASPALAHHPLQGMPMQTFTHGLLSGVGHPVLGFDHLFFIIAVGVAAAMLGRAAAAPLAYLAAVIAGVFVGPVFGTEILVALSLLALGAVLATGRAGTWVMLLFVGFGFFHGAAFGGSILGQEGGAPMAVWAGYLIGLAATQYVIARLAGMAAQPATMAPRLVGAAVAGVGVFLCLEIVEAPLLAMIAG